ncbi:hypothetical protein GALMADRAFT_73344 [Galerina marginata CBS 339.88]|uniref:GST N-terminal domain-containing protein n=1 Tax=Galerina marginata (strain CBS 339.88) TaxID=685588 RepID=A0A067SPQ2_GALM3|nr:hypothetical protein GALMADRAFT_73344 [Galerina marginata CBS 339.88]
MTIIFYDIPSTLPENAWSLNTWKVRYCLNYKGIAYRTEWVEYPDIESHCKKLGIKPTDKRDDGSDEYTLPAIHDPSTGVYLAESILIADYLDKTYPDTPPVLPAHTLGLQVAFVEAFGNSLKGLAGFILPNVCSALNPPSMQYFRRTREAAFGKKLEDLVPQGETAVQKWATFKESLGKADSWYATMDSKLEGELKNTQFLMGDTLSFADINIAGYLIWLRIVWGEDNERWQEMLTWHGGRWKGLMEKLKKYETVV